MTPQTAVAIEVLSPTEIRQASDAASRLASSLAFPQAHCDEIALVVTELGANLLRHASHGTITLTRTESSERPGICVESTDAGPGIADLEQALTDGYSTVGGLGLGLGTIHRLMDELEVSSGPLGGLHVVCRRWVRPSPSGLFNERMAFGAATRPRRPLEENGDAFLVKQWQGHALAGVIDGLGHGPFAQQASRAACHYIEQHFDLPLEKLFLGADRVCRSTRGVVMALARFDLVRQQVAVASVGNVEVRLVGGLEPFNPIVRRGIVGLNAPPAVITEHPWTAANSLIMHSDGVSSRWDWSQLRELSKATPDLVAQRLLRTLGKADDDATVLVAGNARL